MSIGHRAAETQGVMRFEYGSLDAETRIVVQQKTGEIRDRIKRSAQDLIEIGERLIDIKARLGHGQFLSWLEAEFDWSESTARNLMHVAEVFKSTTVVDLPIGQKALYALASPSVPEEARTEAVKLAENGHHVTHAKARQIIADHKPPAPCEDDPPGTEPADDGGPEPPRLSVAGRPALWSEEPGPANEPVAPEEAEAHAAEAEERWLRFLASMSNFLVSLPRRGGIVHLTRNWPRQSVNGAIVKLEQLGKTSLKCASELKEARK